MQRKPGCLGAIYKTPTIYSMLTLLLTASFHISIGLLLYISGWKRSVIKKNTALVGLKRFPLLLFYLAITEGFLGFLLGRRPKTVALRPTDHKKLKALDARGGFMLSAHFHDFEGLGALLSHQLPRFRAVVLPMKHPLANRWLQWMRRRRGVRRFNLASPRAYFKWRKDGGILGMMLDQHHPSSKSISRFFGQPVHMNPLFAISFRVHPGPVLFALPLPGQGLRILSLSSGTQHSPHSAVTILRRYNRILETAIAAHPLSWYGWTHRRFKNRVDYSVPANPIPNSPQPPSLGLHRG